MRLPFILAGSCALALLLTSTGCYYDVESELYPNSFCDTSAAVTFAGTVQPIIQTNCAVPGCHVPGGSGVGDFTSYAGVAEKVADGSFASAVFDQRAMPPSTSSPLSNCDLEKLRLWVNAGHPNN